MAFSSGNQGKVRFTRDPTDNARALDLTAEVNNVLAWRWTEKRVEFKDITPYAKIISNPRDAWRAPGRREWECLIRFLIRRTITVGDLNNLPATLRVWRTAEDGLNTNYHEGRGFVDTITMSGDRRGVVMAEALIKSAFGGMTKVP